MTHHPAPTRRTSSWWRHSLAVIDAELAACEAEGVTGQALVKRVRDAYPFGERAMWPYKTWLEAVRWRLAPLGLARPLPVADVRGRTRAEQREAGQRSLWDGGSA